MGANPRVVSRLTGVDAGRIRDVARTAERPEDLPSPTGTLAQLAEIFGIEVAVAHYEDVRFFEGAILLPSITD